MRQKETGLLRARDGRAALKQSVAAAAAAAVIASSMLAPATAFAADFLMVGGSGHDKAASGDGWDWDGADELALNNYNSTNTADSISTGSGNLNITASGTNNVPSITVFQGDLSITGTDENATLNVGSDSEYSSGGIYTNQDLSISNIELNVDGNTINVPEGSPTTLGAESAVAADGSVSLDHVTGSIEVSGDAKMAEGIVSGSGDVSIKDSDIDVKVNTQDGIGIEARDTDGKDAKVTIDNSTLDVDAPDAAVVAWSSNAKGGKGSVSIENAQITSGGDVVDIATNGYTGQTIGTADATSIKDDTVSKSVSTKADDPSKLKKEKKSAPSAASSKAGSAAGTASESVSAIAPVAAASIAGAPQTPATADDAAAPFAAICAIVSAAMMAVSLRMRKAAYGNHAR